MNILIMVGLLVRILFPVAIVLGVLLLIIRSGFGQHLLEGIVSPRRTEEEWQDLLAEVDRLRIDMEDMGERLEFTERLLANVREHEAPRFPANIDTPA